MRFSVIQTVFIKELREMLRDRRSLLIMFGVPVLLYPLITILIGNIGLSRQRELQERLAMVSIEGQEHAPHLIDLLKTGDSKVELVRLNDPSASLRRGEIDALVKVPENFEQQAIAGQSPQIDIRLDRSRTPVLAAEKKIETLLEKYEKWILTQRITSRGLKPDLLAPIKTTVADIATADQRLGKILALTLPLLVLVTGMLGAFFPAINATTTERELGTLETLLVTPAGRTELLVAKAALVLLTGMLTAAINLVSMSFVLWHVASQVQSQDSALGALAIRPSALIITFFAALPTLMTFAAIVLTLGLMARTYREANAMATPVMLIPLASILIGISEPELSPGLLVTPIANTTLIIREALVGRVTVEPFLLATGSSLVYAVLMLSIAARMFSSEQLVNPSWEPISFAGLRQLKSGLKRRRVPGVDEALVLFCVCLLLLFYVSPHFMRHGLFAVLLVNQLLLILLPVLAAAWLLGWDWRPTFGLRRARVGAIIGGALVGVGLPPVVRPLLQLQEMFWPRDIAGSEAVARIIADALRDHPVLTVVLVATLAGICEELLFRGPIQNALRRALPVGAAIVVTSLLFAGMHMDLHGMPIRTILGIMLGAIALRTGSIFPAMLAHGLYDAAQLSYGAWIVHKYGVESSVSSSISIMSQWDYIHLVAGILLTGAGFWLLVRSRPASPVTQTA